MLVKASVEAKTHSRRGAMWRAFESMPAGSDVERVLAFIQFGFDDRHWVGRTLAQAVSSLVAVAPTLRDAVNDAVVQRALRGARKLRPSAPSYGRDPSEYFDVRLLAEFARCHGSPRLKAIVAVRLGAGIRSGDAAQICFSSVKTALGVHGRAVVKFNYTSKTGTMRGLHEAFGYIDFLPPEQSEYCFAQWLLEYWRSLRPDPGHRLLFRHEDGLRALSAQTLAKVTSKAMVAAGIPAKFKAHALRYAAVTKALQAGASFDEIKARWGWASEETVRTHYSLAVAPFNLSENVWRGLTR